jgi:phosphoserine phosphatase
VPGATVARSRRRDDAVTPAPPVVAAFDFDGTLTRGGSIWPFLVALRGRRRVAAAAAAGAGSLALAAALGGGHADRAKEALLRRTLAGLDVEEFSAAAAAFGRAHYRRHARADVADRATWPRWARTWASTPWWPPGWRWTTTDA